MQKQSKLFPYLVVICVVLMVYCFCIDIKDALDIPSYTKTKTLLDPDYEITGWVTFKVLVIIVVAWFKIGNGFIKFTLELIFWAAVLQGLGLGFLLNLNDLNLAALVLVGFAMVACSGLKDLFGGDK